MHVPIAPAKASTITALSTFTLVATHLSFARAASELGVTPTAVSKAIKLLERELDTRLFNRTTRSVSLTEAGMQLLSTIGPALGQIASTLEHVRGSMSAPSGALRINTSYVAFASLIEPHLSRFLGQYPNVTVDISIDNELSDIVANGYDAGIRLGHTIQRDMVAVPVGGRQQRVVVGAPHYFESHGLPTTPQDLLAHNCIRQRLSTHGRFYEWTFREANKSLQLQVGGQLIFDEMRPVVYAACQGNGIAYVFRQFAEQPILRGELQVVLEPYCPPTEAFYLYYPHRTQLPAKLRAFIDFIRGAVTAPQ